MQVEKKDGLLVNKLCCQYEDIFELTGCDWVFKSKKGSSTDYHQEMNAINFEKWFQEKLIPALPTSTLIVMDNAQVTTGIYINCLLSQ